MKECHCPGDDGIFVAWDIIVLCQLCFVALAWDSEGLSCHGKGLLFCLRADQTRINGVILVLYNYSVASSGSIYSGTTVLQLREGFRIAIGLQQDFGFCCCFRRWMSGCIGCFFPPYSTCSSHVIILHHCTMVQCSWSCNTNINGHLSRSFQFLIQLSQLF